MRVDVRDLIVCIGLTFALASLIAPVQEDPLRRAQQARMDWSRARARQRPLSDCEVDARALYPDPHTKKAPPTP